VVEESGVARAVGRGDVACNRHTAVGEGDRVGRQRLPARARHRRGTASGGDQHDPRRLQSHRRSPNYNPPMTRLFVLALALSVAMAPAAPAADVSDRVTRTMPLPPGHALRVDATIADLIIVGSSRSDVAIEIVRRAPSPAALEAFPVVVEASDA